MAAQIVEQALADNTVMVFSKTYCPYCSRCKSALTEAGIKYGLLELDIGAVEYNGVTAEGDEVHSVIKSKYGHRTVPAVFVKGKLLGGCDDTLAALRSGKLSSALAG